MYRRTAVTMATSALVILCIILTVGLTAVSPVFADGGSGDPPITTPPPIKSSANGGLVSTASVDVTWVLIGDVLELVLIVF